MRLFSLKCIIILFMADIYVACPRCGFPLNIIEPMRDALDTMHEKILSGTSTFRLRCEACEKKTVEVEIHEIEDIKPEHQHEHVQKEEKMLN